MSHITAFYNLNLEKIKIENLTQKRSALRKCVREVGEINELQKETKFWPVSRILHAADIKCASSCYSQQL